MSIPLTDSAPEPVLQRLRAWRPRWYLRMREEIDRGLYHAGLYRGPSPTPHIVKRSIVAEHARRYGIRSLVETGTFQGTMVAAMLRRFETIDSIELHPELHRAAQRRFAHETHVTLHQGDSASALPGVLRDRRCDLLFWLDAHYSGGITARGSVDTPIWAELRHIAADVDHRHVILIDDARDFTGKNGYPTIADLERFVAAEMPRYRMEVADDIIRILPRRDTAVGA